MQNAHFGVKSALIKITFNQKWENFEILNPKIDNPRANLENFGTEMGGVPQELLRGGGGANPTPLNAENP